MVRDHMSIGLRWRMCCCSSYVIFVERYDANSTCSACQIYLAYHLLNSVTHFRHRYWQSFIHTKKKDKRKRRKQKKKHPFDQMSQQKQKKKKKNRKNVSSMTIDQGNAKINLSSVLRTKKLEKPPRSISVLVCWFGGSIRHFLTSRYCEFASSHSV